MGGYAPSLPDRIAPKSVWWTVTSGPDGVRLFASRTPPAALIGLALLFTAIGLVLLILVVPGVYRRQPSVGVGLAVIAVLFTGVPWWGAFWPNRSEAARGPLLVMRNSSARLSFPVIGLDIPIDTVERVEVCSFRWGARHKLRHLLLICRMESGVEYHLLLREGLNLVGTGRRLAEAIGVPFAVVDIGNPERSGPPLTDARGVVQ